MKSPERRCYVPAKLRHFAIECDNVERAKTFYEAVFGWSIRPWGPPGFYQILTGEPGKSVMGALQERREPLSGTGNRGCECTFGVEDIDSTVEAVVAHGGRILMAKYHLDGIGDLVFFGDTEGNRIGAMQYTVHVEAGSQRSA
jgi:predicted enzyme related to lactoylglutathione lyase